MATQPITCTMEESIKARTLQAAMKDDRSFSNMISRLVEMGLQTYWKGFEPVITDPKVYLEANKKSSGAVSYTHLTLPTNREV